MIRLHCYGKPFADYPTFDEAKAAMTVHIQRDCPEGYMDWADPIEWHEVGGVHLGRVLPHGWVTAAKGEWLDHRLDEVADP